MLAGLVTGVVSGQSVVRRPNPEPAGASQEAGRPVLSAARPAGQLRQVLVLEQPRHFSVRGAPLVCGDQDWPAGRLRSRAVSGAAAARADSTARPVAAPARPTAATNRAPAEPGRAEPSRTKPSRVRPWRRPGVNTAQQPDTCGGCWPHAERRKMNAIPTTVARLRCRKL